MRALMNVHVSILEYERRINKNMLVYIGLQNFVSGSKHMKFHGARVFNFCHVLSLV
jgi:hypothetical protein